MLLSSYCNAPKNLLKLLADVDSNEVTLLLNGERIQVRPYIIKGLANRYVKRIGFIQIDNKLGFNLSYYQTKKQTSFTVAIPSGFIDKYKSYSNEERERLITKGIYAYLKHTAPSLKYQITKQDGDTLGRYYVMKEIHAKTSFLIN